MSEPEEPAGFAEWFQDMRSRAWDEGRAHFKGDPMYEQYLVGIRHYFLEAYQLGKLEVLDTKVLGGRICFVCHGFWPDGEVLCPGCLKALA